MAAWAARSGPFSHCPWQAGNDVVTFNGIVAASGTSGGDGHDYLARSGTNPAVNPNLVVDGFRPHCPSVASSSLPGGSYGGDIYKTANSQGGVCGGRVARPLRARRSSAWSMP
jgi:hypothetical protein